MEDKLLVQCFKCNYVWETKSKLLFVSCPNCGSKNRIRIPVEKGEEDGSGNS